MQAWERKRFGKYNFCAWISKSKTKIIQKLDIIKNNINIS